MVGGKRVEFGVKVDIWGVDHDPGGIRVPDFYIRMNLCDWDRECGPSVNDGVFTEEDDLAGRGCFHER